MAAAGLAFGLGLALRRRAPIAAIALSGAGVVAGSLVGRDITDHAIAPILVVIVIAFSAGVQLEGRRLALAFAIGAVLAAAGVLVDPAQNQDGAFLFAPVFTIGAPMLFGQLLRNRTRLNLALRERAWRDERGRAAEAEAAAQRGADADRERAPRRRRARAVGDDRAGGGGAPAQRPRPRRARRDAFAAVEGTGREALTELRRLLGVLRKEDEELALAPQPSLANVDGARPAARRHRDCRSSSPSTAPPARSPPAST